jgi:hypothetical protein
MAAAFISFARLSKLGLLRSFFFDLKLGIFEAAPFEVQLLCTCFEFLSVRICSTSICYLC